MKRFECSGIGFLPPRLRYGTDLLRTVWFAQRIQRRPGLMTSWASCSDRVLLCRAVGGCQSIGVFEAPID